MDEAAMLTVRAATVADVEPLGELLAQSCVVDPVVAWLISDHALRYLTMHRFFTAELEFGVRHGIVDVVGHCDGVAIWYPHPADRLLGAEHQRRRLRSCGDRHGPYAHYTFTAGRLEPTGRHHHLAFLAAAPWLRRQGIGRALLAAHHARLDRISMPAVVEASSVRQRTFYERHGYRVVRVAHLPAGGPPLWAMRRCGDPVDQPPMAAALRVG
ncbi:GNAT family N-acetyltransferase [Solwaraspora sp. WMMA2056]|uniref:GNAT family N-acetyltransferase n=1 Tax=Solwaraspora sp. WMMA2056 TaxID=3015161 RepID=UPI00259B5A0F|nr:GNAT family N-acetyltransferase [Solwaraspora sp. WMMA2056]WJK40477.1 GNAT family N-acetyltransferase [Solwaraspora sp. WMMA2056]